MMTAKWRQPNGCEVVTECDRVIAKRLDQKDRHPFVVVIVGPDGRQEQRNDGTVYLMNDTGATVSQWFISGG